MASRPASAGSGVAPRPLSRRRFLTGGAATVVGALVAPVPVEAFWGASERVTVLSAPRYSAQLWRKLVRGMQHYPDLCRRVQGARVLLKPNLVDYSPERPINTDPRFVVAAVEALRHLGAGQVVVGEGPGHRRDIELVVEGSGLGPALRGLGVPFVDLNVDDVVDVPLLDSATGLSSLPIASTVLAADMVISLPKLKTHHWAGVTLSMKNLFGTVPGVAMGWPKNPLHWVGISRSIVDIWGVVRPAFAIVDGIVGMEGDGPIMGAAVDSGLVVMGPHLPAVDAACARLMGFQAESIAFLKLARSRGGTIASSRIELLGDAVDVPRFASPPRLDL